MGAGGRTTTGDVVLGAMWRPGPAERERSRLLDFVAALGLDGVDALQVRAEADPGWYWDAVVRYLDIGFHRPYRQALDLSRGLPWAEFFPGGGYTYLTDAVIRPAAREPDRVAIVWEGDDGASRGLTTSGLAAEVSRCAAGLSRLGIRRGDRVGIFLPMIPEAAVAVLACGWVGAIIVPMFSGYGPEAVASRLRDAGATTLVTADGARRRGSTVPMKATADAALALAPEVGRCVVVRRTGQDVPMVAGRDTWWDDLLVPTTDDVPSDPIPTDANEPYMVIYTSGTTGAPKGAVHVHAGFPLKAAHDLAFCFDTGPGDTLFWLSDLGWMMGPWLLAGGLIAGATVVLFEGTPEFPAPDRIWELVARHRVTVLGLAPTVVRALMPHGDDWPARHDLSSLRVLGSTGETWNPTPWRWYAERVGGGHCPVINYSGGTETGGGIVGCLTVAPAVPGGFTGPVPGMAADVVDDAGRPVRGEVGELVVRQPWVGMTKGFWGDPDRYLATYWSRFPDVWVHGDWAEIGDDGWFLRGRSDDTLNIAGKRIGPAELESAAVSHPRVREAAAIGVPHPVKGECAVVFVVPAKAAGTGAGDDLALAGEVRKSVAAQLGAALRPDAVHVLSDLPRTRNGKIMRRLLRAAYLGTSPGDTSALENPAVLEEVAGMGPAG
ncbi:MAG: AMP-binding protein [Chloroflexia bacterium]|nr:AMP-binding protein [Chloroflexia bacterium]